MSCHVRDQKVESTEEVEPDKPRRVVRILVMMGVGVCLLAASAFVIDYRGLWKDLRAQYGPLNTEAIELDAEALEGIITVRNISVNETRTALVLDIERGADYPVDPAAYRAQVDAIAKEGDLRDFVRLQRAVIVGELRVQFLGAGGSVLTERKLDVRGLVEQATVRIALPVGSHRDVGGLRISY